MSDTRTQIAATLFQPTPGGYVWRESYRWPLGDAPHYLVSEDQKAELLEVIAPKRPVLWQVVLWSTLCLMLPAACVTVWFTTRHDSPTGLDALTIAVLTIAQVVTGLAMLFWAKRRRLRPLLATLPRTDLRITLSQMRAAATNAMSRKQLVVTTISSVFASTAMLVNGTADLAMHRPIGLLWLAVSLMFAGLALYYCRKLIANGDERRVMSQFE